MQVFIFAVSMVWGRKSLHFLFIKIILTKTSLTEAEDLGSH